MRASSKLRVEQRIKHLERALRDATGEIDNKVRDHHVQGGRRLRRMKETACVERGLPPQLFSESHSQHSFQEHQASLPEGIGYLQKKSGDPADKNAGKVEARKIAHDKRAKGPNNPR